MPDRSNRTFIGCVAFLDIAEYSKRPVAEQIRLKDRFNDVLQEAIREVPVNDRIILDTGDGAAISFLGDPEDALFVTAAIRDATARWAPEDPAPLPVRLGINVGPVRLVKDLNGQPNIIGDGINVAQRIMGFAEPGQILVSRSYYEVVSRLSEGYAQLFRYEGSRTDKHVRAHDLYAVVHPASGLSKLRARLRTGAEPTATASVPRTARGYRILLGISVVAILSGAVAIRILRQHWQEPPAASAPAVKAPSAASLTGAPARQPSAPAPPAAEAAPAARAPRTETPAPAPEAQRPRPPRLAKKPEPDEAPAPPAVPAGSAQILLAVLPWGEVYVDGKFQGVSPPLRMVEVPPGRRTVEVRNTTFPAYSEVIDLKADDKVRVRHRFAQEATP